MLTYLVCPLIISDKWGPVTWWTYTYIAKYCIQNNITFRTAISVVKPWSYIERTKDIPYLCTRDDWWGVDCEYFGAYFQYSLTRLCLDGLYVVACTPTRTRICMLSDMTNHHCLISCHRSWAASDFKAWCQGNSSHYLLKTYWLLPIAPDLEKLQQQTADKIFNTQHCLLFNSTSKSYNE